MMFFTMAVGVAPQAGRAVNQRVNRTKAQIRRAYLKNLTVTPFEPAGGESA